METKYHIFKVIDYKGGELRSRTNLTQTDFFENLLDSLFSEVIGTYEDDFEFKLTKSDYKDLIYKLYQDNTCEYAGCGDYTGRWYISTSNGLQEIELDYFVEDLLEYFWNKYVQQS